MTNFYCNNKVPRSLSSSFFLSLSLSHSQTHTDSRTQLIYSPVAGLNSLFLVHSLSLSFLPTQHPSLPLSYSFKNSISLPLSLSLSYSLVNISLLILDTVANTLTLSFSNPFLSHTNEEFDLWRVQCSSKSQLTNKCSPFFSKLAKPGAIVTNKF